MNNKQQANVQQANKQQVSKEEGSNTTPSVKEIINEKDQKKRDEKYNEYVKNITPKHNCVSNCWKAFLVGGAICTLGQLFTNLFISWGCNKDIAAAYNNLALIFLSIALTGLNIYPSLAKFGGAGTVVPITGFANGVVSPALEYKAEGQVFGIGCKLFIIAGPVILYGIFSSWVLGLIYYLLKVTNIL